MSVAVTRMPRRLNSCATRVVPVNRSTAVRAPTADATAPSTGTSVRLLPRYLIILSIVPCMTKQFMRWTFASRAPMPAAPPDGITIAPIGGSDLPEVAHIMVEGYRGTIDFEDETDEDALEELTAAITGGNGEPLRPGWLLA